VTRAQPLFLRPQGALAEWIEQGCLLRHHLKRLRDCACRPFSLPPALYPKGYPKDGLITASVPGARP
jgi:hypothetical protein